jgi:acyl-homoserine lactone acylase PvdQ
MSTETRMAIAQSTPMPQRSESGVSVRYETNVLSHWDRQALAEVDAAFTYEIAWIPERQCWRSFLCSVSKLA